MISHCPSHLRSTSRNFGHRKWIIRYIWSTTGAFVTWGVAKFFMNPCLVYKIHFALSKGSLWCATLCWTGTPPPTGPVQMVPQGLEPNAEGSSWLALESQIWSLLGFEEMSLAQLECFRLEWKRHTHHWILSPTRPSVLLVLWSSFKATNDGSCWRPTTRSRFALCKWIANDSTVSSFVSLLLVQLAMILAGWNWRFRSTTYNVCVPWRPWKQNIIKYPLVL